MCPKSFAKLRQSDSATKEAAAKTLETPAADNFVIGDAVAATSDFRIGGVLAVEKGCKGTVICHGERPDGSTGVSVQFEAWKDGRGVNVLCRPLEIQLVAPVADAQPKCEYAGSLDIQLRCAWERVRVSADSFWEMFHSSPMQHMVDNPAHAQDQRKGEADHGKVKKTTMGKSSTPLQRPNLKHRRKVNDRSQRMKQDDADDDFDFDDITCDSSQQQRGWSMLIVVLLFVNILFAYVHIQRRAGKYSQNSVKVLTDDSFLDHILAHPEGTLVNIFSSPCRTCAKVAVEFEKAATQLKKNTNVPLVSLNSDLAPSTSSLLQSLMKLHDDKAGSGKRLPTLLWFRRGRLVRDVAQSVQSAGQITQFVHESLQPAAIEFRSYAEFVEAMPQFRTLLSKGKTPPIVAAFGPDPAVHDVLEQVAEKFRGETAFLYIPEALHDEPRIRAYFRDAVADQDYNGSLNVDDFLSWLQPFMVE